MADAAANAHANLLRIRKERVHSTMLVEVLALLIFLAMTFAFLNGILFHTGLRPLAHKKENLLEVEHNGEKLLVPIAREQSR